PANPSLRLSLLSLHPPPPSLRLSLHPPPPIPPPPAPAPVCSIGAVRAALSRARQNGLLSLAEESEWPGELPSAVPITYSHPGTAQQQVFNESLPYSVMRELRKAIADSGLKSSYVTGMLEGIATGYIMLPQDWKDLMRMLLSPAQYVVFESEFKHSASALSDPQHTANQLYGAGQYNDITAQATLTPVHFSRTATCVQRAFRKVPVSGQPLSSFVNIKQQHSEPYHQFIDRLKESVTRQIDNTTAQNELMKKLAFENANTDCKKALQSIIHRPKYDLADMIQACADVGSQSHAMSLLAGAIQATNRPT
ncbi:retrovirus group K member 113 Gag polyproteinpolyprotein-like-like, partial [Podarcis lilfordi]